MPYYIVALAHHRFARHSDIPDRGGHTIGRSRASTGIHRRGETRTRLSPILIAATRTIMRSRPGV
jgi:hypothetical protein